MCEEQRGINRVFRKEIQKRTLKATSHPFNTVWNGKCSDCSSSTLWSGIWSWGCLRWGECARGATSCVPSRC